MKTVIEMAREAGMTGLEDGGLLDNFLAFAELVRADEREACAKLCETLVMGKHCAAAIRARSQHGV